MEPTSTLTYSDLASHIADFAGYGTVAPFGDTTGTGNLLRVDRAVRGGVRKVYSPVPPFDWSFLHVYATLNLQAGQSSVLLPGACSGIEGDLLIQLASSSQGSFYPRIELTNPEVVKARLLAFPTNTGYPMIAAIEQLDGVTLVAGQQKQLIVYPAADQAYFVSFQFYVAPDAPLPPPPAGQPFGTANPSYPGMATGNPFVYGGAIHAETFKEACLAEWECLYDDAMTGPHEAKFRERLAASMAVDRRSKPQFLGKNRDTSDDARRHGRHGWNQGWAQYVLNNGVPTN